MTTTDVFRLPGFLGFWAAGTVSEFGSYVTSIALQVLVLTTLHGTAFDVGLVNASRWVPYLLFGLVIGALVERRRRKPLLIGADIGRGILLGLIPLLAFLGHLSVPILMAFVAVFGLFSLVNDAAIQSFLPRLVPRSALLAANARIDQSSSVAQTSGPAIGGALVSLVGAPVAVFVDAASYFFSAVALSRIRVGEPVPSQAAEGSLWRDIGEGLRWVYGHRTLAPIAISTHIWFVFSSMLGTAYVPFALLAQHLNAFELGLTLSAAGVGGLVGSLFSARIGRRWGAGHAVIACLLVEPVSWAVIALSPPGNHLGAIVVLATGQGIFGLALGASNANEMGYRQAVTPDALQGRTNTTMRSFNRAAIIIGAPLGGLLADTIGYRATFWIGVAGFLLAAAILVASPFRRERHPE
ncbi:MAG: major facilitator superfamily 1 [Frondihabitans sp.]|nr:major facilitator superfamily 1 [Frondihabitans sp.]